MTIKVLAGSPKDRGQLLDQLVKRLLDELGYDDFRVRVSGGGSDLEVKARHRATQAPISCRARALPREIGPDELKRFLASYTRDKKRDRRLVGLFLAFSGLSRPARDWYARMEERGKGEFHVFPPEKILALLRRARLIGPPEVVEPAIKSRIRMDVGPRFLAYHEGHMYWVQMTLTGRKPSAYSVLASHGDLVSRVVARELKRLDPALQGKRFVDLYLRDKAFLTLLDLISRNLEALAKEVREPLGDVRQVVQDLAREGVVVTEPGGQPRWKMDRYCLRGDLGLFLSLARQYLEGPNKFRFLGSAFAARLLATDVPGYLEARWKFRGPEQERAGLYRFLGATPGGLNHALFSPTDRYLAPDGEVRPGFAERERSRGPQMPRFLADLLVRMANDMEHPQFQELLAAKGIKAHLFRAAAKAGTVQDLAFSLQADHLISLGRPAAAARSAQAVRGDPEHSIELGAALLHMEEYEQAVAQFDRGIKDLRDPSRLLTAWNQRGICLLHLKKFTDATTCFNEALRYNANSKLAWYHKAVCLKELGDQNGAQRCCKRALEIDPNSVEARELLQLL
ncbi:MAG: tetratricopeptide repeat protein [candidate division NC10 bacterium]|nr:tetratricopeptide repeat protein [candidate division NC10 bacterium]